MLIVHLVGVGCAGRANTYLSGGYSIAIRITLVHLGAVDIGSRCIAGQIFDVEGGCLAFRTDISNGCSSFLIYHLHALSLARLYTLFVIRSRTGSHGRSDLAHRGRAADHL